jgi:hypothetical protein
LSQPLLEADHDSLDELLDSLRAALASGDVRVAHELLDRFWARLAVHIRAEHLLLFPTILAAPKELFTGRDGAPTRDEATATVKRLREDHNFFMHELALAVITARGLLSNDSRTADAELDAVREMVEAVALSLAEHNKIEEEQLYNWSALLLSEEERADIAAGVRRELQNLPARIQGQD